MVHVEHKNSLGNAFNKTRTVNYKLFSYGTTAHICALCSSVLRFLNPLKKKLLYFLFKNSVRTLKRTLHFTITKINWLMLFKEIIAAYSENHTKPINTKCSITDCQNRWFIYLPLGFKGLITQHWTHGKTPPDE
jgi:hypothetical protein